MVRAKATALLRRCEYAQTANYSQTKALGTSLVGTLGSFQDGSGLYEGEVQKKSEQEKDRRLSQRKKKDSN